VRILIVAHGFPPTHGAGAERRAERMANWLVANHHEVEVFALEKIDDPHFRVETSLQGGYKVHRVFYNTYGGPNPFRNSYEYPPIADALRAVLAHGSFDLVHLVSGYLLAAQAINTPKAFGLPVVVTLTEYWFLCTRLNLIHHRGNLCSGPETDQKCMRCLAEERRPYQFLSSNAPRVLDAYWSLAQHLPAARSATAEMSRRHLTLRRALDAADLVICPSRYLISKFAEFGFDTQHYRFIRQGLVRSPDAHPATAGGESDILRLGYVGQIKAHKGVDLFVDAVTALLDSGRRVSLDIWGDESAAPEYVTQLKGRTAAYPAIRWNGQYSGAKVWDVLAKLDALVVPSRWYENSPTVILEAYAMHLPVVATNLGGMAELVEHESSGLLFELNDAGDLRRQLERLLDESDLLERLRAGIPPVKTVDQEMNEIVAHYERLIGEK
jgi:glycosyltransferase involved in cell wall biosynthesis